MSALQKRPVWVPPDGRRAGAGGCAGCCGDVAVTGGREGEHTWERRTSSCIAGFSCRSANPKAMQC